MIQSLLVYWALMTMGPILMGFVFISTTYVISMTWFFKGVGIEQYLLNFYRLSASMILNLFFFTSLLSHFSSLLYPF